MPHSYDCFAFLGASLAHMAQPVVDERAAADAVTREDPAPSFADLRVADDELPDVDQSSPFHKAAFFGNLDAIKAGAVDCSDVDARDRWGLTPLHWAVIGEQHDVSAHLLRHMNARADIQDMYGFHSLTYAAGRYPSIKFFAAAKASGCNISAPNKFGSTALHAACLMENREIVSLLVKLGADINAVDATGKRPHDCFKTPQGQQRNLQALAKLDAAAPPAEPGSAALPSSSTSLAASAETAAQTDRTGASTQAAAPELHVGCSVLVNGLQARPDLNGCSGIISGPLDAVKQRWPVRISAGQQSEDEELLLRAANLTLLAPAEPVAAAPICCRRDHGVFISDAYIQLMTPHVNAMLASPTSSPSADSASFGSTGDEVEIVKVQLPVSSQPVTRSIAAKSPEVCGPLLYNQRRSIAARVFDTDAIMYFVKDMGSSSKKFYQMKRFDAGRDEGGLGWLLQAQPAVDMQPW